MIWQWIVRTQYRSFRVIIINFTETKCMQEFNLFSLPGEERADLCPGQVRQAVHSSAVGSGSENGSRRQQTTAGGGGNLRCGSYELRLQMAGRS